MLRAFLNHVMMVLIPSKEWPRYWSWFWQNSLQIYVLYISRSQICSAFSECWWDVISWLSHGETQNYKNLTSFIFPESVFHKICLLSLDKIQVISLYGVNPHSSCVCANQNKIDFTNSKAFWILSLSHQVRELFSPLEQHCWHTFFWRLYFIS